MNSDLYDKVKKKIIYLKDYYLDWQDYIERFSFPRIDYYFLLVNISSFYNILDYALYRLDNCISDDDIDEVISIIPNKIEFNSTIYNNIANITKCLKCNMEILKKYEENQETNE